MGEALRAKLDRPQFGAAVFTPGRVLLNTAVLTSVLVDDLSANLTTHENSSVIELAFQNAAMLPVAKGSVLARFLWELFQTGKKRQGDGACDKLAVR